MTTPQDALRAWKQLARFAESMAALVPWLDDLGSIEQAVNEAKNRLDIIKAEEKSAAASLLATQSTVNRLAADIAAQTEAAKAASAKIIGDARQAADVVTAQADAVLADARDRGTILMAEAKRKAQAIGDEAKATMGGTKAEIDKAEATKIERQAEVRKLTDERDAIQRDIAALKAKHGLT